MNVMMPPWRERKRFVVAHGRNGVGARLSSARLDVAPEPTRVRCILEARLGRFPRGEVRH
jgi:hypothetical protein